MAAVVGAPRLGRMDLLKRFLSGTILIVTITVFLEMGLLKLNQFVRFARYMMFNSF